MLHGIDPILGPDMLYHLRAMGHGDEIALVDANYPALEHARRLVRADGLGMVNLLSAILPLLPLDHHPDGGFFRAVYAPDPEAVLPIYSDINAVCDKLAPNIRVTPLDPHAFYARVRQAHVVVATGERALYANVILRKGVISPENQG